jgi:hypothetical protein
MKKCTKEQNRSILVSCDDGCFVCFYLVQPVPLQLGQSDKGVSGSRCVQLKPRGHCIKEMY